MDIQMWKEVCKFWNKWQQVDKERRLELIALIVEERGRIKAKFKDIPLAAWLVNACLADLLEDRS